ncbi:MULTISPECIES: type ISP restriction/modification enzyme [Parasutterella]|uniref:type ISP restriction/modification enzyme n=9 Tax=Sutterellaceae TaxID=995019 RepID=UPI00266670DF|nr:type ISP restriction/modification enzyme [Parasutterella excrementihominis]
MSEFANNESAFEALLESIKQASNNIKRDAGTRFETLIKDWLTQDQPYRDLFSKVETFEEWASSHPDLKQSGKDIGIDLVATLEDDPKAFAAIQCKFYDKEAVIPKSGVDSFIAASNRDYFKQRYIITTNENWSGNALAEMQNVTPPIQLVGRSMLASSQINWSVYLQTGKVVQQKKRTPRKYQEEAIQRVLEGFKTNVRGKLIMACGTGKTFTSMKIAERMEGNNGFVMFLVPSLALLSQTLTDWKRQCAVPIHAFAVCSDSTTGKADLKNVDETTSASDLCYPATTKAERLAEEVKKARNKTGMTVIFSTYQSIEVVSEAQHKFGMEEIGLIICDEAHRTAGGHYQDESDAPFQRIHSDEFIKGKKRLYMTATPRIYGDVVKEQKNNGEVVLYSMDDEQIYGPTFHTITFSQAVALGSLVDYKVIVLSVEENILKERALSDYELVQSGGLPVKHAAKVIGCWRALSKLDLKDEVSMSDDRQPMRRAVGFAQIIEPNMKYLDRTSSKRFTENFESTIEEFKDQQFCDLSKKDNSLSREVYDLSYPLKCETRHIDGSMNSTEKDSLLNWLREEPEENVCKILFNVRCLSEGVDVPSLDAVLFLSPRKSQVEVVQTVGRVMRVSPRTGKKRGYVIIPIVTPADLDPSVALNNNADFDVVWQVLNALKSIDTEFGAIVDGQRNIIDSSKIEVVCITNKKLNKKAKKDPKKIPPKRPKPPKPPLPVQEVFDFNHDEILEQEIRARIVKRVGNRREWGDWAEDVGKICQLQIKHINDVLKDPTKTKSRQTFESFKKELKATLNDNLTDDEIVEMLGQHVVTQPILDALFTIQTSEGTAYEFSKQNPIAVAMTSMMDTLDRESMKLATKSLEDFYRSVRNRTRTIKTSADRQLLIKELFEKFFKAAFPKQQEKLGIVYTPIEIVDFINQSVADLLKKEFNCNISDDGIHILDPFSGTGTFIARLMQSGLISTDRLPSKFEHELHANEIVPLAYYVASMNIEGVFHELCPNEVYQPNKVMIWTDTFANNKQSNIFTTELGENNARLAALNRQDIRVIVGNPPYSVGQESANDDNQNDHYEELDARLAATYVQETASSNKNKLYDSYIRAYRWASDRIGNQGVMGFVTNAGWLDSSSADGMRKCMTEEFNSIYIYHLKGNQRTSGERSRLEGGKVFGEGSRAPVAIVFLVKNPRSSDRGKIYFHAVDDYLTREEKLAALKRDRSISNTSMNVIVPDAHGDWFNQRDDSFSHFMRMDGKKTKEVAIFKDYSLGVNTNRDAWVYNSSRQTVIDSTKRSVLAFNKALGELNSGTDASSVRQKYIKDVAWSSSLVFRLERKIPSDFSERRIQKSLYRPFFKQNLYFDPESGFTHRPGRWRYIFPDSKAKNLAICSSGVDNLVICINQNAKDAGQIALMTDHIADLHFNGDTQCFPRWLPGEQTKGAEGSLDFGESKEMPSGFSQDALPHFQAAYPGKPITEDDLFYYIYGILHSEDYRTGYANNLMKELPRIPRVATYEQFMAFVEAGQELARLHVHFEDVELYTGVKIEFTKIGQPSYRVTQMKWGKIKGKTGNAAKDKTTLIYNDWITVKNIPLEAQEYVVNKKSALDWVVERACVSIDKVSDIVNDFNDYAADMGSERYPLDLFLKVITVSLQTMEIVKGLPKLEIHPLDK